MARKKLHFKDFKEKAPILDADQQKNVKGGYRAIPSGAGSYGWVNTTGIDIRDFGNRSSNSVSRRLGFKNTKP